MIATESEARERWCPFVRFTADGPDYPPVSNRGLLFKQGSMATDLVRCIASQCMAWEWKDEPVPARTHTTETGTAVGGEPPLPEGEGWRVKESGLDELDEDEREKGLKPYAWTIWEKDIPAKPGTGFCGLARRP